jgi:hypothetical protein
VVGPGRVGETGRTDHTPCVVADPKDLTMSPLKRLTRLAVGAILATGLFAGAAAPASAAVHDNGNGSARVTMLDTGWGG